MSIKIDYIRSFAVASPHPRRQTTTFTSTGNPILADGSVYSADPAPVVVNKTVYILSGRDEAGAAENGFIMNEWQVFEAQSPDPSGGSWSLHQKVAQPHSVFFWAKTGTAYAGQIVQGTNRKFYMYAPVTEADSANSDPFAIGVAVSSNILGPFTDAHASGPIISESVPSPGNTIQNIDPTVLVDTDGRVFIYFGTFGRNYYDHMATVQWWELRHPERGLAMGTPLWKDPAYQLGKPVDWIVFEQTPKEQLAKAFEKDGCEIDSKVMDPNYVHTETLVIYVPTGGSTGMPNIPFDGNHISTIVLGLMPTSRGSITLASAVPRQSPVVDPNFYAKEADRASLRYGVRQVIRMLLDTPEGKVMVKNEVTTPDCSQLTLESTDAEIDDRIRKLGNSLYHSAGSLAMGKV
ncbi:hypothetical protein V490_08280 [Pseudogymnoascus sp. VKM F-3557]|nr:hypothetical protein V490_08280 [Pseudogymnoascus sp. VKM F-3557]